MQVRINKLFTEYGICSRRAADQLIEQGRVLINGQAAVLGAQVGDSDVVTFDGMLVENKKERELLIAYNKPTGVESTMDPRDPQALPHFLKFEHYVFTIGRLDQMSEGLLLLTNQGDWVNRVLRKEFAQSKEYVVELDRPLRDRDMLQWQKGVEIGDRDRGPTLPCKLEALNKAWIKLELIEGRNRQIRRVAEALGYRVKKLRRIRVANIELGDLGRNRHREVGGEELLAFKKLIGI